MLFSKRRGLNKCIALILAEVLIADTAFSQPLPPPEVPQNSVSTQLEQPSPQPEIYYIADIHANVATQQQIFEKLSFLVQHNNIDFIGIEGAWNQYNFDSFYAIPDPSIRKKMLDNYFKKGLISGVEYFCCVNKIPVYGLEDESLYHTNRQQYVDLLDASIERDEYIRVLKRLFTSCSNKFYSSDGFLVAHLFDQLHKGNIDIAEFGNQIRTFLERHSVVLNKKLSPALYHLCYTPGAFFPWNVNDLIIEIKALKTTLRKELVQYHNDRLLLELQQKIEQIDALFSLNASSEVATTIRDNYRLFQFRAIFKELKEICGEYPEFEPDFNHLLTFRETHDNALRQCLDFYEVAQYREFVISSKTEQNLKQLHANKCLIFTGGFHRAGIENYFHKKNVIYTPITLDYTVPSSDNISYTGLIRSSDSVFKSLQASQIAVEALFQSDEKTAEVVTNSVLYRIIDLIETQRMPMRKVRTQALEFVEQWKSNFNGSDSFNEQMYIKIRDAVASMEESDDALILPVPYKEGYFIVLSHQPLTKHSFPPQKGITQFLEINAVDGYKSYLIKTENQLNKKTSSYNSDGGIVWTATLLGSLLVTLAGALPSIDHLLSNFSLIESAKFVLSFFFTLEMTIFTIFRSIVSTKLAQNILFSKRKPVKFMVPEEIYPEVTLQFPIRNEPFDAVKFTIDQALIQDYPPEKLHFQIIDNSNLNNPKDKENFDKIVAYAQEHGIQLIHRDGTKGAKVGNLNLGFLGDPARGIEPAKGELLCCIDCETRFTPDALKRLIPMYVLNRKNAGSFRLGSRYGYAKDGKPTYAERGSIFSFNFLGASEKVSDSYSFTPTPGDFLLVARDVLQEMGGWLPEKVQEKTDKAEDHALTYELLLRGRNVVLVNTGKPIVGSGHPQSFSGRIIQLTRYAYGGTQLLKTFLGRIIRSNRISFKDKMYSITRLLGDMPLLLFSISVLITTFTGVPLITFFSSALFGSSNGYFLFSFLLPMYLMSSEFKDLFSNESTQYVGLKGLIQSIRDFMLNLSSFFLQAVGSYVEVVHAQFSAFLGLKKPFVSPPREGENRTSFLDIVRNNKKTFLTIGLLLSFSSLFNTFNFLVSLFQHMGYPGAMSYVSLPDISLPAFLPSSGILFLGMIILVPFIMDWNPLKDFKNIKTWARDSFKSVQKSLSRLKFMRGLSKEETTTAMDIELLNASRLLLTADKDDFSLIEAYRAKHSLSAHEFIGFSIYKVQMVNSLQTNYPNWLNRQVKRIRDDAEMSSSFDALIEMYKRVYRITELDDIQAFALFFADFTAAQLFNTPLKGYLDTPFIQDVMRFINTEVPESLAELLYSETEDNLDRLSRQHFYLSKLNNVAPLSQSWTPYMLVDILPDFTLLKPSIKPTELNSLKSHPLIDTAL
ncbi:MAG: glycosyltransferase family 2 protein [Candidatus Auribacterota bacterium]